MRLGIIGLGAVGGTIYKVLRMYHEDVRGYDVKHELSKNTLEEVLECEATFLCVPTAMGKDGRLDTSAIISNLNTLVEKGYHGLLVVKSTLPVGFFKNLPNYDLDIVFNPEFLHASTAIQDFINPPFVIASGKSAHKLMDILYWIPKEKFYIVNHETAILAKLVMNAFAATKISFVNEIEKICDRHGVNPITIMQFLRMEGRCAEPYSHPRKGPFGGTCLPKDLMELITANPDTTLLRAVHSVNEETKKRYS
jgi:UDPglucose 6-dehydrogenase